MKRTYSRYLHIRVKSAAVKCKYSWWRSGQINRLIMPYILFYMEYVGHYTSGLQLSSLVMTGPLGLDPGDTANGQSTGPLLFQPEVSGAERVADPKVYLHTPLHYPSPFVNTTRPQVLRLVLAHQVFRMAYVSSGYGVPLAAQDGTWRWRVKHRAMLDQLSFGCWSQLLAGARCAASLTLLQLNSTT